MSGTTPDIPESLRPQMERVIACSPYAAGVMAHYPQLLQELAVGGRLGRTSSPGEISALVAAGLERAATEDEILRRLRHVRHRELLRVLWRDIASAAAVTESPASMVSKEMRPRSVSGSESSSMVAP